MNAQGAFVQWLGTTCPGNMIYSTINKDKLYFLTFGMADAETTRAYFIGPSSIGHLIGEVLNMFENKVKMQIYIIQAHHSTT